MPPRNQNPSNPGQTPARINFSDLNFDKIPTSWIIKIASILCIILSSIIVGAVWYGKLQTKIENIESFQKNDESQLERLTEAINKQTGKLDQIEKTQDRILEAELNSHNSTNRR